MGCSVGKMHMKCKMGGVRRPSAAFCMGPPDALSSSKSIGPWPVTTNYIAPQRNFGLILPLLAPHIRFKTLTKRSGGPSIRSFCVVQEGVGGSGITGSPATIDENALLLPAVGSQCGIGLRSAFQALPLDLAAWVSGAGLWLSKAGSLTLQENILH